jgi:DHA1 family inner membrane transport protein
LIALALGAFAFVTTETLPIGLLPQIAASLQTTIPQAGLLVTTYAFTVALCAVPATALTARLTRRRLLVLLLGTLLVTNVAAALATSYTALFAARVVNAVAHAVFWSIVGSCGVRLVPERLRGTALAIVYGGVSLATVGGVPAATFVGQRWGWKIAFAAVAVTAAVVLTVVAATVEDSSRAVSTPGTARTLLSDGAFRALLATTILSVLGQFVAYTYIVPYVVHVDDFTFDAVAPLLLLFGIAGALGNLGAGAIANRNPATASLATTACIAAALVALCSRGDNHDIAIASLAVWGLGAGGLAVGLQTRVLALAPRAPDLASALFAASYNIGIGGGALLGSLIVSLAGLKATAIVGAGLAFGAVIVAGRSLQRERRKAPAACPTGP